MASRATLSGAASQDEGFSEQVERLDALVREDFRGAAATVAVARKDQPLKVHAVGMADLEQGVKAGSDTVYCIGSISKTFAAAATLQLVEQGRLALDDELSRYLPNFPTQGHAITIHQLLHHESGIQDFEYKGGWSKAKAVGRTKQEVVDTFRNLPLGFPPGTRWQYSTSGYYLIGLIIEAVAGKTYEDYLREHVFEPAGLTATTFCAADRIIANRARGYARAAGGEGLVNAELADLSQFGLGGGICSTAADLLRFWRALLAGKLVSQESIDLMKGPHALADGTPTSYGYGLFTTRYRGMELVGHSGGVPGFSAQLLNYPSSGVTIAVLGNSSGKHILELERRLAEKLVSFAPILDRPVPDAMQKRIVGCYQLVGPPAQIQIVVTDERAELRTLRAKPVRLNYQGGGVFSSSLDHEEFSFDRMGPQAATAVSVRYGTDFAWRRAPCDAASN